MSLYVVDIHGDIEGDYEIVKKYEEPRKDEIILTNKEYRELLSSEFDNGYEKGFSEALEQNDVLDKIREEIMKLQTYKMFEGEDTVYVECDDVLAIIDKYGAENEVKEVAE